MQHHRIAAVGLSLLLAACTVVSIALHPSAVFAAEGTAIAFVGGEVRTVSGEVHAPGTVVIRDGRIESVGSARGVPVPPGALVRDVSGRVLIPGLVDTHTHIGIYPRPLVPAHRDGNDTADPVQPQLRALDAIWPEDPGIKMAVAGGITTANIMPGSGNVVGGQTAYVKLRGDSVEEMLIADDPLIVGGLKMANGENPKRVYAPKNKPPMTRMSIAALQRKLFVEAIEFVRDRKAEQQKARNGEPVKPPGLDLRLQPMVQVLGGRRVVHHHTHRSDDILSVLRLKREFGFDVVLHHATEAYRVVNEIVEAKVPVSVIMLDSPGGKLEASDYRASYAGVLERAGVEVAIHTDDFVTPSRLFLRSGAMAVRAGMSEEGALRALTLNGAKMLRLDRRVGSLEVGKDADLVLLSGPPFALRTQVLETWIDGERVFDRSDPKQRRYATGGIGVSVGVGARDSREEEER